VRCSTSKIILAGWNRQPSQSTSRVYFCTRRPTRAVLEKRKNRREKKDVKKRRDTSVPKVFTSKKQQSFRKGRTGGKKGDPLEMIVFM
jgi:hypothetical protein